MRPKYTVGLEGGVAAGKSSAGNAMRTYGYVYAKEYMSYLDPRLHEKITEWPQSLRLQLFADIEAIRVSDFTYTEYLVLDRTFLTIFAHDFALQWTGVELDIEAYSTLDPFNMFWPDKIVFFDIDNHIRRQRLQFRPPLRASYLADPNFNFGLKVFFQRMQHVMSVQWLDTPHSLSNPASCILVDTIPKGSQNVAKPEMIFQFALELLRDV